MRSSALLLLAAFCLPAAPAAAVTLAAHHAFYKLTLANTRGGDVVAAYGTMTYDVRDACNAWAVQQQLDLTTTTREGADVHTVSDYATWESKDGRQMRFHMRQTTDGAVSQQVEGSAKLVRAGGPGTIRYTAPDKAEAPLPRGTMFPMWQTAAIIAAAEQGKRFVSMPLFDGTGPDGAQDSFVFIDGWNKPGPAPFKPLAALPSGYVHVSFFPRSKSAMLPDYTAGMRYWSNGVADDLRMDFGDFVMHGKLTDFQLRPGHC